jgi:O-antigen/teichoic acid export membrane protein
MIVLPAALGVSALSSTIAEVVLGDKWLGTASLIEVLAIFGIARAVFAVSASAFMSTGAVDILAKLAVLNLFIRLSALSIGYFVYGVLGLAWALSASAIVQMLITLFIQQRIALLNYRELVTKVWRVLAASAVMYLCLSAFWPAIGSLLTRTPVLSMFLQILYGVFVYFITLTALWYFSGKKAGPEILLTKYLQDKLAT